MADPRRIKIRAQRGPYHNGVEFLICQQDADGQNVAVAGAITMDAVEEGTVIAPTLRLSNESAQLLMDELWSCGLRPTEGTGSTGQLAATERHLADMRRIAFAQLSIDPKG